MGLSGLQFYQKTAGPLDLPTRQKSVSQTQARRKANSPVSDAGVGTYHPIFFHQQKSEQKSISGGISPGKTTASEIQPVYAEHVAIIIFHQGKMNSVILEDFSLGDERKLLITGKSQPALPIPMISQATIKNPVFPGWYADPEIHVFNGKYYIYPTTSLPFEQQTFFECWSSDDLSTWRNEGVILRLEDVRWSTNYAAWAPSIAEKNGKYFFYFSAGDGAGIGVAVSSSPAGPFRDAITIPLVAGYPHGAQAIDAHCFIDDDGEAYLYFGGHGRCVVGRLAKTMCAFRSAFREITPCPEYVEGPFMIKRRGKYYLMWSQGDWSADSYVAAYGVADNPHGPFKSGGIILKNNPAVGAAAGHHSVLRLPGTEDEWIICYHRRPIADSDPHHRVVCIDRLIFREDGSIAPVTLTNEGVFPHPASCK